MLDVTCLAESKTPHDLPDTISEIKWMEVLKSISPKKRFTALFSRKPPACTQWVPARVHAIQLFFGIVSPHGNVDSHECTYISLNLSNNWLKEQDPVKQPQV